MSEVKSARKAYRSEPVLLVATENPKKKGSMSYDRFQGYFEFPWPKDGIHPTVNDLLTAKTKNVVRMDDIKHDSKHGFIVVGQAAIDAHLKQVEIDKAKAIEEARKLVAAADKK